MMIGEKNNKNEKRMVIVGGIGTLLQSLNSGALKKNRKNNEFIVFPETTHKLHHPPPSTS